MKQLIDAINNAENLTALCAALNAYIAYRNSYEGNDYILLLDEAVETYDLPIFGTYDGDTCEIFSWDDDNLLVQSGIGGFEIVPRDD